MPEKRWAPHPGRRLPLATLLAGLSCLSCTGGQADALANDLPARTINRQPSLVLGSASDNPDQQFARVVDARLVGDSAVLVASAGTHDLRLFNLAGKLLRVYGREGKGPGENEGLDHFFMRGDTLWTFDWQLLRVDRWSLTDGYSRSMNLLTGSGQPVWQTIGAFPDGSLLVSSAPQPQSSGGGTMDTQIALMRWIPGSTDPIDLESVFWKRMFYVVQPGMTSGYANPLSGVASIGVSGSNYWYTDSRSATLEEYSMKGELLRTVELPFVPDPVTSHDREVFDDALLGRVDEAAYRKRVQAVVDGAVYPETLPAITDLIIARDGSVWAGHYIRPGETERTWYVVSADGEGIERVSIPAEITLLDVAGERVLGVKRDENDVEHIVVYHLAPPQGTAS